MQRFTSTAILSTLLAILSACSNTPIQQTTTPSAASAGAQAPASPAAGGNARPVPQSSSATMALPQHLDPNSPIFRERSIFFDFDDFSIKQEFVPVIERHGKYLLAQPAITIRIEGNADERGSAEYNLALGQKRAQAVLRALALYGVKESRMEAVSWGKERPKATGHDEQSLAQNRRADLVYPRQQ